MYPRSSSFRNKFSSWCSALCIMNTDHFLKCFKVFDNLKKMPYIRVYRYFVSLRKSLSREVAQVGFELTTWLKPSLCLKFLVCCEQSHSHAVIKYKGSMSTNTLVTMRIIKCTKDINAPSSPGGRNALGWKPTGYFWNENAIQFEGNPACLLSLNSNPPASQES